LKENGKSILLLEKEKETAIVYGGSRKEGEKNEGKNHWNKVLLTFSKRRERQDRFFED